MKIITVLIALLGFGSINKVGDISADVVAIRYCTCAGENNLVAAANIYKEAKDNELKQKAKGEYLVSLRKTQECIKLLEVQEAVRKLPREQRTQFEKNVMKILTERCGEVAQALQLNK